MAFSARAKPAKRLRHVLAHDLAVRAAELGEQQPLRLELGPGPSGQAVRRHHVDADQLTGLAGGHAAGAPDEVIAASAHR